MSGPNSPFSSDELEALPPEQAANQIASWKPTEQDSWELRSARGVGRQLEELVKKDPQTWAQTPVRMVAQLRHPTYVSHYFRGLASAAQDLDSKTDDLIRAVEFVRTHPWPSVVLGGDDFDYDPSWRQADETGIGLIEALVKQGVDLSDTSIQKCWEIVLGAVRDNNDGSSLLSHGEPLTSAINRPCTKALETVLHLVGYQHQRSVKIPDDVLTTLTDVLSLEGEDGIQHRAILAPRIPFLRKVLPEWLENNFELFLGNEAPDDLAQRTIDLTLKWGHPDSWLLERFRSQILSAIERGVDRALDVFLLGMFWGVNGYDVASCVIALAGLGPKYVSDSGEASARLLRHEDTPNDTIELGAAFWEESINLHIGGEAFHGFGWWAEVSQLDPDRFERLMAETCKKTNGKVDWVRHVAGRAASRPMSNLALEILAILVRAPLEVWERSEVAEQALLALKESLSSGYISEARSELRRVLLEQGHFEARDL